MDQVDITIVGAGVVGLAIARRLSVLRKEIVLLEKHDSFGRETSSRNSEVIHAGFYYPTDSLKARLCVEGNRRIYEICRENAIPHQRTGKIVIGTTQGEQDKIARLHEQGQRNGAPGELIDSRKVHELEPAVTGKIGLWSPSTGIMDTHQLMKYFESAALANGITIAYNCELIGVSRVNGGAFKLEIHDADGQATELRTGVLINAAGLWADAVAAMAGIGIDEADYRLHWCKGEYFSVSNRHRGTFTHLVYPAPTEISLGIHAVLRLDGTLKLGPNAFYVDEIDYNVAADHQADFHERASTYLPFLTLDDLSPDTAGIRPKLQAEGEPFRDFVIREESDRGVPGLIDLIGIESPGLTSAPAIADYVHEVLTRI